MTIQEAIHNADTSAPNDIEKLTKLRWLSQLDGEIAQEVFAKHEGTEIQFDGYDEDIDQAETELLVQPPYDELYVDYLIMRINLINQEIERYNNSAAVFSESLRRFENHFHQTHMPKQVGALQF